MIIIGISENKGIALTITSLTKSPAIRRHFKFTVYYKNSPWVVQVSFSIN